MPEETSTPSTEAGSRVAITFGTVTFDTPDPRGTGTFYADLLGWRISEEESDETWVKVRGASDVALAFQLAPDLIKPTWPRPEIPQQAHLELYVDSYDEPQKRALELGATLLDDSDDHADFRVYADPAGHPFCFCLRSGD